MALEEPGIVAVGEAAGVDGLEIALPGEEFASLSTPVLVWFGDGFFVEGLVFVEACLVRRKWVSGGEFGFTIAGRSKSHLPLR